MISAALLERVLSKLGLDQKPTIDLAGLNQIYAAFSAKVPNDNIRKRIWLVGDRTSPVSGGDPIEFFENWLLHGTGGTCFPANGALCELLLALGFEAQRVLASVMREGIEQDGNHGTVAIKIGGTDYLADAQLAAFSVLPLIKGERTSTGQGIHDISATPFEDALDIRWYPASNRLTQMTTRIDLPLTPVGHDTFIRQYDLSALRDRRRSPFNEALFVGHHLPERIISVYRNTWSEVSSDNTLIKKEVGASERKQLLINEFKISRNIVEAIPPDEESSEMR